MTASADKIEKKSFRFYLRPDKEKEVARSSPSSDHLRPNRQKGEKEEGNSPILSDPNYDKEPKVDSKDYYGTEYNAGFITSLMQLRNKDYDKSKNPKGEYKDDFNKEKMNQDSPAGTHEFQRSFPGGPK